nr:PAS domain S-box protein [Nitrospirota bacterium]
MDHFPSTRSLVAAYGCAVLSIVLATGVRLLLDATLGDHLPFVTYFVAVMFTAWFAGWGPSLVAMGLGFLAASYFFVPPRGAFAVAGLANQIGIALYFFVGIVSALLSESQRRAQRQALANAQQVLDKQQALELEVAERTRAEAQVRQLTAELEQRIVERTAQLAATNQNLEEEIAERKRAEDTLCRSEERFRSLVLATTQMVWITDAHGQATADIPTWRQYTGQSYEELRNTGWIEALHPDDCAHTMAAWREAVRTRSPYDTEYRVRRHDGVYQDFSVRGVPILEPDGTVREWVGTCTDITERKQAEEMLRRSEELLRKVLDILPVGVWILDQTGRIVRGNSAAQQIWAGARYVGVEQFGEYKAWWADTGKRIEAEDWA